jgi:hypothetical protein
LEPPDISVFACNPDVEEEMQLNVLEDKMKKLEENLVLIENTTIKKLKSKFKRLSDHFSQGSGGVSPARKRNSNS